MEWLVYRLLAPTTKQFSLSQSTFVYWQNKKLVRFVANKNIFDSL